MGVPLRYLLTLMLVHYVKMIINENYTCILCRCKLYTAQYTLQVAFVSYIAQALQGKAYKI